MLGFTLVLNMISGIAPTAFPNTNPPKTGLENQDSILTTITGTSDTTLNTIWLGSIGLTFALALGLAYLTQSMTPIGIYIFSSFFWTSYLRLLSVISFNFIPADFITIFTVGILFVFVGAIIGIMTGSG
jgi:hypothetical protein